MTYRDTSFSRPEISQNDTKNVKDECIFCSLWSFQDCESIAVDPSLIIEDFIEDDYYEEEAEEKESLRRHSEEEYDYVVMEDGLNANWKTPVDLAKDFMGSMAFVGQAIFAPWTLPGQPFGVDPE